MAEETEIDEFMFKMMTDPSAMAEQLSYMIWGSIVTSSRSIKTAKLNVSVQTQRVFVEITFHWWARFKKFDSLRVVWINRARERSSGYIPNGWRYLIYEQRESGADIGDSRGEGETSLVDPVR